MRFTIRRAEPRDAESIQATMSDPSCYGNTLQLPWPGLTMWQQRLEGLSSDQHLLVAETADGEVVGNLMLAQMSNPRRRHVGEIGMAVAPEWQGKGVGSALLAAAIELGERWLALSRLELDLYPDNTAAQALYSKFGFEPEGIARAAAFRDGTLVDVLRMARIRPQPSASQPA
ncbi:GNAT family N-acetyltransferase [Ferrimonas balearica]|uniref:GNAT family N-acetyltransferase n=1 Tax=Ferrimonas balearica TaxID=44012 RepID=UPI001C99988D|nr:GNAT family N-acetyltransferase [Ferrimonas balearica]MBY5923153.1 GNAT family N-acetyltransferase [Ferrimonas balearica]MBY5997471.1 GNAT family N-acetyltransferase [Ferrimonas balearica]